MKAERDQTWARIALLERSRRLEREILSVSEREQERIGQDLHDGLCQYFAAVACAAASLRRDLSVERSSHISAAADIEDLIKKGVTETRNLARGLFPIRKEDNGLESALQELTTRTSRLVEIPCAFECNTSPPMPDANTSNHLYRITQEALNNAIKHGKPTHIDISLEAGEGEIVLSITDDGVGMGSTPEAGRAWVSASCATARGRLAPRSLSGREKVAEQGSACRCARRGVDLRIIDGPISA